MNNSPTRPDDYQTAQRESATVDAIVIGAGPAGLAAAQELASCSRRVCLIDEQIGPGGQIWRNANPTHQWAGVQYHPASSIIDVNTRGSHDTQELARTGQSGSPSQSIKTGRPLSVTWLQHDNGHHMMRETQAAALVIATGAMERPVLFPGSQLPGVMGVGAVQSLLKQAYLVPRGNGVILAGQGPLLLLTLQQILAQGASIDAVLNLAIPGGRIRAASWLPGAVLADPALVLQGLKLLKCARGAGVPVYRNITELSALGDEYIEEVRFVSDGKQRRLSARLLAVHDGVMPNTQLPRLLNLEHQWNDRQQSFEPTAQADGKSSDPQVWVTGDGAGIVGAELAVQRGLLTGVAVAHALEASPTRQAIELYNNRTQLLKRSISRRLPARQFIDTLYSPLPIDHLANDDTVVCRCEAVSVKTIRQAIAHGAIGPNRVKTFTRCGMGACQGRQCGTALSRLVAQQLGKHVKDIGALRIRPPLKPTLIADYLAFHGTDAPGCCPSATRSTSE